jgi:hypothetical protein
VSSVNPVRNSSRCDSKPSGALNPARIILKSNPTPGQRGIISNGVKKEGIYLIKKIFSSLAARLKGPRKVVGEIMYGLLLHETVLVMKKERGHLDNLFMLVIYGDLVGLPLLPPYYSLRLLPHIIPSLETWKRRVLREKDLTDFVGHDL